MKDYKHITEMENILNSTEVLVNKLNELLDKLEENKKEYLSLIDYYYSDKRYEDLDDDEKGLIPSDLNRGVLSEDLIYNLISDYHQLNIRMIELGLDGIKNN